MNDVQDADIAALLAGCGRYHAVLRLQQSSHDVQYRSLTHCFGLLDVVTSEWRVRSHEEVAAWHWDQRCNDADKIVMHIAGISKGGC